MVRLQIDLNARDNDGWTAFIIACQFRQRNVVKLLVQHSKTKGIDISTEHVNLSIEMRRFIDSLQYAYQIKNVRNRCRIF